MIKQKIRKSVETAIDNVIYEGCTDVSTFGKPFELNLLKDEDMRKKITDDVVEKLNNIVNSNGNLETLKIKKISHMLVPKKTFYDFRKCALIDIVDEIKYLSLVLLIASDIESKRVSKTIAYSYRYQPNKNGRLFNKDYNYSSFKNEYKKISSQNKYNIIIECDISNFYDRLNLHRLNSTLLSISSINSKITDIIDQLLLFWANRDSYGLPVGSNASRILAEAFLIEIDNYLLSHKIRFCRFVDDYRFFAADVSEANRILSRFVEILNKHGLSINLKKTCMRDIKGYHTDISKTKKSKSSKSLITPGIIMGYSGLVPTKFRQLSESEINKLQEENAKELISNLKKDSIIEPTNVIKSIKVIVAQKKYSLLCEFPDILKKYPQFIPYFSNVIFKNKEFIVKEDYSKILDKLNLWLKTDDTPEYILISIVKMFDAKNEDEKNKLFDYFKNLKRNSGVYLARTILEQIGNNLTRGELLELKDYFLRADNWEKRQMVNMFLNGLSYQENRPFLKDLKINCDDYFIETMAKKYEKKKR